MLSRGRGSMTDLAASLEIPHSTAAHLPAQPSWPLLTPPLGPSCFRPDRAGAGRLVHCLCFLGEL